jgi:hypothetical protein
VGAAKTVTPRHRSARQARDPNSGPYRQEVWVFTCLSSFIWKIDKLVSFATQSEASEHGDGNKMFAKVKSRKDNAIPRRKR